MPSPFTAVIRLTISLVGLTFQLLELGDYFEEIPAELCRQLRPLGLLGGYGGSMTSDF